MLRRRSQPPWRALRRLQRLGAVRASLSHKAAAEEVDRNGGVWVAKRDVQPLVLGGWRASEPGGGCRLPGQTCHEPSAQAGATEEAGVQPLPRHVAQPALDVEEELEAHDAAAASSGDGDGVLAERARASVLAPARTDDGGRHLVPQALDAVVLQLTPARPLVRHIRRVGRLEHQPLLAPQPRLGEEAGDDGCVARQDAFRGRHRDKVAQGRHRLVQRPKPACERRATREEVGPVELDAVEPNEHKVARTAKRARFEKAVAALLQALHRAKGLDRAFPLIVDENLAVKNARTHGRAARLGGVRHRPRAPQVVGRLGAGPLLHTEAQPDGLERECATACRIAAAAREDTHLRSAVHVVPHVQLDALAVVLAPVADPRTQRPCLRLAQRQRRRAGAEKQPRALRAPTELRKVEPMQKEGVHAVVPVAGARALEARAESLHQRARPLDARIAAPERGRAGRARWPGFVGLQRGGDGTAHLESSCMSRRMMRTSHLASKGLQRLSSVRRMGSAGLRSSHPFRAPLTPPAARGAH
eukprot:scaffold38315_cov29-Tisochrysis_lutea.AAC.2